MIWAECLFKLPWAGPVDRNGIRSRYRYLLPLYLASWDAHPEYPEAPERLIMMTGAMGEGVAGETPRFWFDRAVAGQMDHPESYRNYRRWMTDARPWRERTAFGAECIQSGRWDTGVPLEFHAILSSELGRRKSNPRQQLAEPGVYELCGRVYVEVATRATEAATKSKWKSQWAAVAWAVGDLDTARRLLSELGEDVAGGEFGFVKTAQDTVEEELALASGATGRAADRWPILADFDAPVMAFAFSSDGTQLATGDARGGLRVWNTRDWDSKTTAWSAAAAVPEIGPAISDPYQTPNLACLGFSTDNQTLFAFSIAHSASGPESQFMKAAWPAKSMDEPIRAWQAEATPKRLIKLAHCPTSGILATADEDGAIWLWDSQTLTAWNASTERKSQVGAIALSANGKILAVLYAGVIKIWEIPDVQDWPRVKSDKQLTATREVARKQDRSSLNLMSFRLYVSNDGKWLACQRTGHVLEIWDVDANVLCGKVSGIMAAFSPDGRELATTDLGSDARHEVAIWDPRTATEVRTCSGGHLGGIMCLAYSPDGTILVTGGNDRRVRLWNPSTGRMVRPFLP